MLHSIDIESVVKQATHATETAEYISVRSHREHEASMQTSNDIFSSSSEQESELPPMNLTITREWLLPDNRCMSFHVPAIRKRDPFMYVWSMQSDVSATANKELGRVSNRTGPNSD
jgi:hypothetical protein